MRRFVTILTVTLFGLLLLAGQVLPVYGQFFDENHPELSWRTIETEHFYVHVWGTSTATERWTW